MTTDSSATGAITTVNLTDTASSKVKTLLDAEGRDDLALRIAVQPGAVAACAISCSSTTVRWTATRRSTSTVWYVVVDRMSQPYLGGATIDFVDTIEKQGFTIDNPNATGSCACGDSFH